MLLCFCQLFNSWRLHPLLGPYPQAYRASQLRSLRRAPADLIAGRITSLVMCRRVGGGGYRARPRAIRTRRIRCARAIRTRRIRCARSRLSPAPRISPSIGVDTKASDHYCGHRDAFDVDKKHSDVSDGVTLRGAGRHLFFLSSFSLTTVARSLASPYRA